MKIGIISFSEKGYDLSVRISEGLMQNGHEIEIYTKSAYNKNASVYQVDETVGKWTARMFPEADALIYVGACGIAVRSIAPYVKDKKRDPAVLVVDDRGQFVISLLSGHIGGANELTMEVAAISGGKPVITTATDIHNTFAVDVFAKKNGCYISEMKYAKEISAALLAGETVGFYSDFPWIGELPQGLKLYDREDGDKPELGIVVSASFREHPFLRTLYLVPRVVTVGIGCRRGTPKESIENTVRKACNELLIPSIAMEKVASIDVKKDEKGILDYCRERKLSFVTFTAAELEAADGQFTPSPFVKEQVGVDNVCERSAMLACLSGRMIHRKLAENGVTVALAMKKWSVNFE